MRLDCCGWSRRLDHRHAIDEHHGDVLCHVRLDKRHDLLLPGDSHHWVRTWISRHCRWRTPRSSRRSDESGVNVTEWSSRTDVDGSDQQWRLDDYRLRDQPLDQQRSDLVVGDTEQRKYRDELHGEPTRQRNDLCLPSGGGHRVWSWQHGHDTRHASWTDNRCCWSRRIRE